MSDREYFSLRCNEFESKLATGFNSLFEEEAFLDVTLGAGGHFIKAHKLVLSIYSPYFKKLFLANPCEHPIVLLKDVELNELEAVLQFMYKGEVNVAQDDLPGFLKTAEMLQVNGLASPRNKSARNTKTVSESSVILPKREKEIVKVPQHMKRSLPKANRSALDQRGNFHSSSPSPKRFCIETSTATQTLNESKINVQTSFKQEPGVEVIDVPDEDENNFSDSTKKDVSFGENDMLDENFSANGAMMEEEPPDDQMIEAGGSQSAPEGATSFLFCNDKGIPRYYHNGNIFHRNRTKDNQIIYWKCMLYERIGCKARCTTTYSGELLGANDSHNHVPTVSNVSMIKNSFERYKLTHRDSFT